MNDNQLETVTILAGLINKAHLYDVPLKGKVLAVPVKDITETLERFTTAQTNPPIHIKGEKEK